MRRSQLLVLLLVTALGAALWSVLAGPRARPVEAERAAPSREASADVADAAVPPGRRSGVPYGAAATRDREGRAPAALGRDLTGKVVVTVRTHDGEPAAGVPVIGGSMDAEGVFVSLMGEYGLPRTDALGRVGVDPEEVEERYAAQYFGLRQAMAEVATPREVVLPPLGAVAVDLRAFRSKATVSIRIDAYGSEHESVDAGGVCRFDHVPLGETFSGLVRSDGRLTRFEFTGPSAAGETVTVAPEPAPTLRVRARPLGPDGTSIADERFELVDADGRRVCILDDDDGDGWIEADVAEERFAVAPGDTIELRERRVGVPDEGAPYVLLDAPTPDAEGVVDLGELCLAAPPVLAAGVVVDGRGRPVPRATVRVNRRQALELAVQEGALGLGGGSRHDTGVDRDADAPVARVGEARADRSGRFELRVRTHEVGYPEGLVLVASARRPERHATAPLRVGATDHRLAFAGEGTFAVDLSDIPRPVRQLLRARLHSRDRHAWQRQLGTQSERVELAVPAGRYVLEIRFGLLLVAEVEGLVVPPGALCADPRLAPLVLDRPVERRRLRVQDPEGEAVAPDRLWYAPATFGDALEVPEPPFAPGDAAGEVVWFTIVDRRVQAYLGAAGYAPAEITDVADGGSVVLERLERVRLVFEGAAPPSREELASMLLLEVGEGPDVAEPFDLGGVSGPPVIHTSLVPGRRYRIWGPQETEWSGVVFAAEARDGVVVVTPE